MTPSFEVKKLKAILLYQDKPNTCCKQQVIYGGDYKLSDTKTIFPNFGRFKEHQPVKSLII